MDLENRLQTVDGGSGDGGGDGGQNVKIILLKKANEQTNNRHRENIYH